MKTTRFFTLIALAATVMATYSCSKEVTPDNDPVAVRFTSQLDAQAKAAGTTWGAGDAIGIRMVDAADAIVASYANQQYTTTGTGAFTASAANMYYPMDGSPVNFIAYYPYLNTLASDTYDVVIAPDQTTAARQAAIDLLWAKTTQGFSKTQPVSVGKTSVELTFAHKLAKLVLVTLPGTSDGMTAADLADMSVAIKGMNTFNIFDLKLGDLAPASSIPADITPLTAANGARYEAIVMPDVIAASTVTVEFTTTASETFVWEVPAVTLVGGSEYTYTITLKRTGVTATGTITAWNIETPGTGDAE